MIIRTINGLAGEDGTGQETPQPVVTGLRDKVRLQLPDNTTTFRTYGFEGWIDFGDTTKTLLIVDDGQNLNDGTNKPRYDVTHTFSYSGKSDDGTAAKFVNLPVVTLYFQRDHSYGYIDGKLLSQAEIMLDPLPEYVFTHVTDDSEPTVITRENWTCQTHFTDNLYDEVNFSGSSFTTYPTVYGRLDSLKTFPPSGQPYNMDISNCPNVTAINPQGTFGNSIETIKDFNIVGNGKIDGSLIMKAYPGGGSPKNVINSFNCKPDREGNQTLTDISNLPDPKRYFDVSKLEVMVDSFQMDIKIDRYNSPWKDQYTICPDFSQAMNLKYLKISIPKVYVTMSSQCYMAFGSEFFFPKLPPNVVTVDGYFNINRTIYITGDSTDTTGRDTDTPVYFMTYEEMKSTFNFNGKRFDNTHNVLMNPCPNGVKNIIGYFSNGSYLPISLDTYKKAGDTSDSTTATKKSLCYIPEALPDSVEYINGYFDYVNGIRPAINSSWQVTIPPLPKGLKYIREFCTSILQAQRWSVNDSYTVQNESGPTTEWGMNYKLYGIDNFKIMPPKCTDLYGVDGWMTNAYYTSNIDLSQNTSNLIVKVPPSPSGNILRNNIFNGAFAIESRQYFWDNKTYYTIAGKKFKKYAAYTGSRTINVNILKPYMDDWTDTDVNTNVLVNAISEEFYGELSSFSSYVNDTSVIFIDSGDYHPFSHTKTETKILTLNGVEVDVNWPKNGTYS